jgi:acyl-[acyl-carrier-protein]-phospholipid O-acyltransferase / long-chain-fatty-acid--[acyl-carrier-protein] ligase
MREQLIKKNISAYLLEIFLSFLFRFRYEFAQKNTLKYETTGIVLVGNHTSFIDWAFLQMGIEQKIHFFIEKEIYEKPILKPFLRFFGALPIDSKNAKESFKKAIEILKNGGIVVIFPEGELTKNGQIGEFKKGFEFLAQKSGADVVPFCLNGLYGSRFSKNRIKNIGVRNIGLIFGEKLSNCTPTSAREVVSALRLKLI